MISSNGQPLDLGKQAFGELESANELLGNGKALKAKLEASGYLFFRKLISPAAIAAARHEILLKYSIIGEIDPRHPLDEAVFQAKNSVDKVNLRAFSLSVRSGLAYQQVILNPALLNMYESIFEDKVAAYDFRWPRFVRPGEACGIHCDGPYMARGAKEVYSSWIPLGDVAKHEGGLIVLERGPHHEQLLRAYLEADADKDKLEWLSTQPADWREQFSSRWLTTDFQAGDVLCFKMDTVHGALDNNSPTNKCRLSSDTRYQRASEPFDDRWNGNDPEAHGHDKVFYPGLGNWNNADFQDEWKPVDQFGRLTLGTLNENTEN